MRGKKINRFTVISVGVLAFVSMETSGQPAYAQEPINVEISPTVPTDLPPPPEGETNNTLQQAAIFAWKQFIAVTWPAKNQDGSPNTRDQPDTSGASQYGDQGPSGQVVWETYRHKAEIFPGKGDPNGFDTAKLDFGYDHLPEYVYEDGKIQPADPSMPAPKPEEVPFNNLDEVDEILLCNMNAGIAKPDARVLYQAKANRVLFNYIAKNNLWRQTQSLPGKERANAAFNLTQDDPANFRPDAIELPASDPDTVKIGTIEIKSAWRRLNTDTSAEHHDDPSRFYVAKKVRQYRKVGDETRYVDSQDNELWGLIALHVIQKTKSSPTFVYTTFEQVDNIRAADGKLVEEASGKPISDDDNVEPFTPALTINESGPAVSGNNATGQTVTLGADSFDKKDSPQLYYENNRPFKHGITVPVGINKRLIQIPKEIYDINERYQTALKNHKNNPVWQHYKLVNVQAQTLGSFVDRSLVNTLPKGLKASYYLANIVVETNAPLQQFSGMLSPGDPTRDPDDPQRRPYEKSGNSDYFLIGRPGRFSPTNTIIPPFTKNEAVANTVVKRIPPDGEKFWERLNMGGCLGCHGGQGQLVGGDFSVIVARGRVIRPEVPEFEETPQGATNAGFSIEDLKALNRKIRSENLSTNRSLVGTP